jgi:hypothetical protein
MTTSNTAESVTDPYVRLRTILDSVEDGCIRYYLEFQDSPERNKRFDEISAVLMPVIEFVWGGAAGVLCPPGYTNCDGVCVPYVCPRDPEERAKAANK